MKISMHLQQINYELKYADYDRQKKQLYKKREDFKTRALVKCLLKLSQKEIKSL